MNISDYSKKIYNNKTLQYCFFIFLFLFFNIIMFKILVNKKIDLTTDKLYTVSENTKSIIKNLSEPINIKLFFSNSLSKELSQIRDYEKRVRELLISYKKISNKNDLNRLSNQLKDLERKITIFFLILGYFPLIREKI